MAKIEKPFVGEFGELLDAFVKHKRNVGYKYKTTRENLQRFSVFTLSYHVKKQDSQQATGYRLDSLLSHKYVRKIK